MIIDDRKYDVIVIGSGAGGGTLAGALSKKGQSVRHVAFGEQVHRGELDSRRVLDRWLCARLQ